MEQLIHSPKDLGKAIKRQRNAKKLNQKEAGKTFKIEQSTVSSIEQGAPGTRLETLFRLLAALDLEMILRPKKSINKTSIKLNNSNLHKAKKINVSKEAILQKNKNKPVKKTSLHKIKVSW